jgi:hypothetical protein
VRPTAAQKRVASFAAFAPRKRTCGFWSAIGRFVGASYHSTCRHGLAERWRSRPPMAIRDRLNAKNAFLVCDAARLLPVGPRVPINEPWRELL